MALEQLISMLDIHLTDFGVGKTFLDANEYRLEYDSEIIVFSSDVEVYI